jgi:hypothetical protein
MTNQINHIFFINSPIILCVSLAFMQKNTAIMQNAKIITSRRQCVPPFLKSSVIISFNSRFSDRIFIRFKRFFSYLILACASKSLKIKPFIFYCSYSSAVVKAFITHPLCISVRYVEEGQLSFRTDNNLFDSNSIYLSPTASYTSSPPSPYYSRNSDLFLCTHANSFPLVRSDYKFVVDLINLDVSWYKSKTLPGDSVAILPSRSRLSYFDWLLLPAYIHQLFDGDYFIKFHPSFCHSPILAYQISKLFLKLSSQLKSVSILPNDAILELEMMNHVLHLKGPQTSLDIYAFIFGSTFERIEIPGWILREDKESESFSQISTINLVTRSYL